MGHGLGLAQSPPGASRPRDPHPSAPPRGGGKVRSAFLPSHTCVVRCLPKTYGGSKDTLGQLLFPLLIIAIFYLLVFRPQQQKVKAHAKMVSELRRGDQVVTQGGLIGKVTKVKEDNELEVEVAQGVKVRVVQDTILRVVSKTEPAEK